MITVGAVDSEQSLIRGYAKGIGGDLEDQRQNAKSRSAESQAFHHQSWELARSLAILGRIDIAAQKHAEISQI